MSARDWNDLERRVDEAIDALNDERTPDLESDEEMALLDTLRVVRRLREPADPEARFEDRLVDRTLAGAASPSLVSFPNGSGAGHLQVSGTTVRRSPRRTRLLLGQVAAVLRLMGVFVLATASSSRACISSADAATSPCRSRQTFTICCRTERKLPRPSPGHTNC